MFYAARGSIPPKRHTQHRAPDGSLYAEELFGVEGFTGRSSLLYHVTPPTRTHRIEPVSTITLEEADDGYHHHRLIDAAGIEPHGDAVTGRIPLFFNSDIVMGVVRPAEPMPETVFYRNGEADETALRPRGRGPARHQLRADPLRPRRLPGPADRDDLAPGTRRGECPADALPRVPVGDRAAQALPQRLRPAARALALLAARHPAPRRGPGSDRRGRIPRPRQDAQPADGLPLHPSPVRRRRLGWLPVAVCLQHLRLRADHRAGPPAAAGPPDVRGSELRRLLVRAAQVRLPPARHPGALQPLEHQLATRSSTTSRATS